jgi:hypothetical protein
LAITLAYNLGNFLRTLATQEPIKDWSLTSLKEKLIKIGAKVVSHGRYVFQMAEVAIPRQMFQEILRLIGELRRSHQHRQHEMFDSHAFQSNRREDRVRMPSKTARSGSRKPLGWSGMPVAIHPSRSGFQAIQKIGTIQASSGIIRGITGLIDGQLG